jgi:Sec-independent protein translocase protein TatA
MAEAVCKLLKIFYTATTILSGSDYPTVHLYFYQLWKIKKMLNTEESRLRTRILNEEASTQDITISNMLGQMQTKFNVYWKETYNSACIPIILDPRFKYDFLEFLLSDFGNEEEAGKWMGEVKSTMQELFNEYTEEVSVQSQRESDTEEVEDDDDPLVEWDQYMRSKKQQSSNELDRYLKEELTARKAEVDILEWWKINSSKYPVLSKMARDILAISASTVPSESAFSTGGRVISDYSSGLVCSTVEALVCLQDWFKAACTYFLSLSFLGS